MALDCSPSFVRHTNRRTVRVAIAVATFAIFYVICLKLSEVDVGRLWEGLPRLGRWALRAWPPDLSDFSTLLWRAGEMVAMATVGTSIGAAIAAPLCLLAARNTSPYKFLHLPTRWLLNVLRGTDSFVFALLFVAAVGLGPFAGVLGIAFHSAGSLAKLWSESIETAEPGPVEAAIATGARELRVFFFALLPDVMPSLSSAALYMWEFNVRAPTVLGIVALNHPTAMKNSGTRPAIICVGEDRRASDETGAVVTILKGRTNDGRSSPRCGIQADH